jgi:O-antigen ligase
MLQSLPIAGLLPGALLFLPEGLPAPSTISISPDDTTLSLLRWMSIVLVGYFAMQICANSIRATRFLSILFWIVVVHAIYGLLLRFQFGDTILFARKWAYQGSATGGFVNRNSFATFLAIGAVIGVTRIHEIYKRRPYSKNFGILSLLNVREGAMLPCLGLVLIMVALVASTSRMGLFAALIGMAIAFGMISSGRGDSQNGRYGAAGVIGAILVGALVIMYLYGGSVIDRFSTVDASSKVRMQLYGQIWEMIKTRPLTGYGGGAFEHAYPMFHQVPVNVDLVWDRAHSSYLALWSEYGLVFGTLPMLMIVYFLSMLVSTHFRSARSDAMIIAAIGATVAVAVHATVDFSLEMHAVTLLYVALLAGAVGKSISIRRGLEAN